MPSPDEPVATEQTPEQTTEPELCRVPGAARWRVCAYAGNDGMDACGISCRWVPTNA